MIYPNMIGVMEIAQFMRQATPAERKQFQDLVNRGRNKEAWALIAEVIGIKLPEMK